MSSVRLNGWQALEEERKTDPDALALFSCVPKLCFASRA